MPKKVFECRKSSYFNAKNTRREPNFAFWLSSVNIYLGPACKTEESVQCESDGKDLR